MSFKLSDKVKNVISAVAPTLGAALGGPLGGLAGTMLTNIVGGGKPQEVEKLLLSGDPDALLKLKNADNEFIIKLRELDISEEDIHAKDRQSARELAKVDMKPQKLISALFLAGYFIILGLFFVDGVEVPENLKEAFLILIGVLTAGVPSIMQFWFGSSTGSKEKSINLANAVR